MNRDQVKGALDEARGKMQEQVGKVFGSFDQQFKGIQNQIEVFGSGAEHET